MHIQVEDLTAEHVRRYGPIFAVSGVGDARRGEMVAPNLRLPPFVGRDSPGTITEGLEVEVPSLDEETLAALRQRIEELRAEGS